MNLATLRDMSRAYALGSLDRETYRMQRHALLTRIAASALPVLAFAPPEPEQRTVFPYEDDTGDTTQEILAPLLVLPTTSAPRKGGLLVIVAVIALALGAGGWALRHYGVSEPASPTFAVAPDSASRASDPLTEFLIANLWHSPNLDALGERWDSLDSTTREQLRSAPSMRRLIDKVLEQIQAERALLTLGDAEEALATQQQLLDLMTRLGAQDPRLLRAREAWQAARAEQEQLRTAAASNQSSAANPLSAASPAATAADADTAAAHEPPPAVVPTAAPAAARIPPPSPATIPAPPARAAAAVTATPVADGAPARQAKSAAKACKADLAKTRRPYCQDALNPVGKGPALVVLPGGEFAMGGEAKEEQPRHTVRLERPFAIALFEVSGAEFARFCTATHSVCPVQPWSDPALPVVNVSWAAATAYTQWLSKASGANYRLPSEAEWEYAARAGSTTSYPFGNEILPTHARYSFKNPVATPLPANDRSVNRNAFKLYHMLGNVREWVQDAWQANYGNASGDGRAPSAGDGRQVARGGSYADRGAALRSAARVPLAANGDQFTGFRVLREID